MKNRKFKAVVAIALCLAMLMPMTLTIFANTSAQSSSSTATAPTELSVMSFNILNDHYEINDETTTLTEQQWNDRHDIIINMLDEKEPTSIGLQEFNDWAYNYMKPELKDQGKLANYGIVEGNKVNDYVGISNPILYNKDVLTLKDSGSYWLSDTPNVESMSPSVTEFPNVLTWALLEITATGEKYLHVNTHLHWENDAYKEQFVIMMDLIENKILTKTGTVPYIVTGDFNVENTNLFYKDVIAKELYDAGTTAGVTETVITERIDHICYDGEFVFNEFDVIDSPYVVKKEWNAGTTNNQKFYISDHRPVMAKFNLATVWNGTAATAFAGGTGTAADPYKIATAEQLAYLAALITANNADYTSKHYTLVADILLNDVSAVDTWTKDTTGINKWPVIGRNGVAFSGTFDGQGHTVYGMFVDANDNNIGLFSFVSGGTVKNVTVDKSLICGQTQWGAGAIAGRIANGASIIGCASGATINISEAAATYSIGGIVGAMQDGDNLVENCANYGDITVAHTAYNQNSFVGGIIGGGKALANGAAIKGCVNTGNITAVAGRGVGGILGFEGEDATTGKIQISDCYNTGNVTASDDATAAAGILGFARTPILMERCYNVGVCSDAQLVGIYRKDTGDTVPVTFVNCYYDNSQSVPAYGAMDDKGVASTLKDGCTLTGLSNQNGEFITQNMTDLFDSKWAYSPNELPTLKDAPTMPEAPTAANVWDGSTATAFAGGTGTEADPYQISNAKELAYLASVVNAGNTSYNASHYILTADIFLNDITNADTWTKDTAGLKQWTPIGTATATFGGCFDGNGYTVYGMFIAGSFNYAGLFGYIVGTTTRAIIEDVSVCNSFIGGTFPANAMVGSIIGCMGYNVTVDSCLSNTNIDIAEVTGDFEIGGIIGWLDSTATTNSTNHNEAVYVKNCANYGDITIKSSNAGGSAASGGIMGRMRDKESVANNIQVYIESCMNMGNIDSDAQKGSAGIIGFLQGYDETHGYTMIDSCYNTGNIQNNFKWGYAGGIIGAARGLSEINNSYNTGVIRGTHGGMELSNTYGGQMVGIVYGNYAFIIENCYYNIDDTAAVVASFQSGASAATKDILYLSFNKGEFTSDSMNVLYSLMWSVVGGEMPTLPNVPTLKVILPPAAAEGDIWNGEYATTFLDSSEGTEADPIEISTAAELALLAKYVNDGNKDYNAKYYVLTADIYLNDITNIAEWSKDTKGLNEWPVISRNDNKFMGQFDGQGHTVYGMFIAKAARYMGLFGFVGGSSMQDVARVMNVNVRSGFICGATTWCIGSIAGRISYGEIIGCTSDVTIKVDECIDSFQIGGIVGALQGGYGAIKNCANHGDITVTPEVCANFSFVGGITAGGKDMDTENSIVSGCYNTGDVSAKAGRGIAGILAYEGEDEYMGKIDVSDCYNTGNITALNETNAGGIVGFARTPNTIKNCFNTGVCSGAQIVAKFRKTSDVKMPSMLENCYYDNSQTTPAYSDKDDKNAAVTLLDGCTVTGLSQTGGEFVSEKMSALGSDNWKLEDGKMPILRFFADDIIVVLGAQIREKFTEYYDNGTKVSEGQGIRFGVGMYDSKYSDSKYSITLLVAKKTTLGENELTLENAEYKFTSEKLQKLDNNVYAAYIVPIAAEDYATEFVVMAVIMEGETVVETSAVIVRSVNSVATALGGTIDANGDFVAN